MNNEDRDYWEKMVEEFEEVAVSEMDEGYYNDSKIPDLEELVTNCPYIDLNEKLTMYAMDIECHIVELEIEVEDIEKNYLEYCFDF